MGNGSLCYFSIKEDKRLVMIDGSTIAKAAISKMQGCCHEHAFTIRIEAEDDEPEVNAIFACETEEEYEEWAEQLKSTVNMDDVMQSFKLGGELADDLKKFKRTVQNRRVAVKQSEKQKFVPVFKAKLWKLKAEGNKMNDEDWFEREMWLSKNGSLVYFSKKDQKELVYYSSSDVENATLSIQTEESCKPWGFQVQLPTQNGIEHMPGEFAAESDEMRTCWMKEFGKFSAARS